MKPEDLIELYEYCYREGKEINRGRCVALIVERINELKSQRRIPMSELELAQIDNEIEDLELLKKRVS